MNLAAVQFGKASGGANSCDWFLKLNSSSVEKPSWLSSTGRATLDVAIASQLDSLERTLGRPWANAKLPIEARIDEVRGWLRIDAELEHFRRAELVAVSDVALRRVLLALVAALTRSS